MRALVGLTFATVLLAPSAFGEEASSPFRGEMRQAIDADGRVSITVPKRWTDKELAEGQILRVYALGSGGHDIMIQRRPGQADVDAMRDEFLKHDSASLPGSTIKKLGTPFFGYRVDAPTQKRVVLRAFAADGTDGLVLTITSRYENYEKLYWERLSWVAGTLKVAGVRTGPESGKVVAVSGAQRVHDKDGRLSVIAPAGWKSAELQDDEILAVAPGGRTSGTRILINYRGGSTSDSLVLAKVAAEWKRSYGGAVLQRLPGTPPRLLVKGRQGDSVDYFIGLANGDDGYTVRLVVREGSYERIRSIADEMARTLVFQTAAWKEPRSPGLDLDRLHRKALRVHGAAEYAGNLDQVAAEFDRFLKQWGRLGLGFDRKAPPIHALVCPENEFAEKASLFGEPPATYNRQERIIVATPPGSDKNEQAAWRGALDAAFTEAILHRDLKVAPPPWFRRGLASCMRASGLQDGKPDGELPALVGMLVQRSGEKLPERLATVLAWTEGDYLRDETADKQAHAWGYVHVMLFGKGGLPNAYKKWRKALLKATKQAPSFDPGKYDKDAEDLQAFIGKTWGGGEK